MAWWIALALQAAVAGGGTDCQAAIGDLHDGRDVATLPNQVDGATIDGPVGLARLRAERTGPIILNGGSFAGGDFTSAHLSNICFVGTDLSGSNWTGARAPGIAFIDTNLEGAKLNEARMPRILLRQANLTDVNAYKADFSGGKMDGGWDGSVENLDLQNADLTGFRFDCGITIADGCPLHGEIRVNGANLTDARLANYFRISDWTAARLDRTELGLAHLPEIRSAFLAGPIRVRGGDTVVELTPEEHRTLLPFISFTSSVDQQASFDCARAGTAVERAICAPDGDQLRVADVELAQLYERLRATRPASVSDQREWLRGRDACGADAECLAASYEERKGQLIGRLGPPEWATPGAVGLFIQPDVDFSPRAKDHPLFRRLLPVVIDGASARVAVKVAPDGSIEAAGGSIAANAHLCSLNADGLRFDPRTGWYSGPYKDDEETPPQLRGRPMPVLRFIGDSAEVYRNGKGGYGDADPRPSDYASCGARAYFGDLVRVPVTPAQAEAVMRSYGPEG